MSFVPPTDAELRAVRAIRERLIAEHSDLKNYVHFTEITTLRFYRGHKGHEDRATTALKNYLQWRKEHDVDNIFHKEDHFRKELDAKKAVLTGADHHGRPTIFAISHRHDKHDRVAEEVIMLTIWCLEKLRLAAKPDEERFVAVLDLGKFTMKCMDYDVVRQQIHILQTHYPDTLEALYVVDAPFIFNACWLIIKPWLDPVTASKVHFIKSHHLKDFMDEAIIPPLND